MVAQRESGDAGVFIRPGSTYATLPGTTPHLGPSVLKHRAANGAGWARTANGVYVPPEVGGRAAYGPRPIAIDLFCGAGGATCGLFQGGFRVIAGLDYDTAAASTYMWNNGTYPCRFVWIEPGDAQRMERQLRGRGKGNGKTLGTTFRSGAAWIKDTEFNPGVAFFFLGDARKITGEAILNTLGLAPGDVDLVFGGPPCQGFSTSGKRDVMDPRNSLVFEFARLVCEIQPKTMVMENVPGIVSMITPEGIPVLDALSQILTEGGMGTYDALRATLAGTAGLGAVLKTNRPSRAARRAEERAAAEERARVAPPSTKPAAPARPRGQMTQLDLFSAAGAGVVAD